MGVDLNEPAINFLRDIRFANATTRAGVPLAFFANDGMTIPGEAVANATITLVFSWDSMVHFPPIAVTSYLAEVRRVLRPGGTAFLHHSNLRLCDSLSPCPSGLYCRGEKTMTRQFIRGVPYVRAYGNSTPCGILDHAHKNPQGRNAGTTCESVAVDAQAHGLRVTKQERLPWGARFGFTDCLTWLERPRRRHRYPIGAAGP